MPLYFILLLVLYSFFCFVQPAFYCAAHRWTRATIFYFYFISHSFVSIDVEATQRYVEWRSVPLSSFCHLNFFCMYIKESRIWKEKSMLPSLLNLSESIRNTKRKMFWNPWNYWCSEGTRNHQRVLTMMSQISRDIKPLLQHNSGNNLIFVPWLQSVDTVYVDGL